MVELLGLRDEVLRAIEDGFTSVDVHVRGNEVTLAGPAGDVALVARLVEELVEMTEGGTPLTPDVVQRTVAMLAAGSQTRPADVLTFNILSGRGRTTAPRPRGRRTTSTRSTGTR
jgi:phosphate starvation-inducible PhoH-like protein